MGVRGRESRQTDRQREEGLLLCEGGFLAPPPFCPSSFCPQAAEAMQKMREREEMQRENAERKNALTNESMLCMCVCVCVA